MSQGIELAEAIGQLRAQLNRAIREGEGEDLRFEVKDLELELQVVVTKDAQVAGKVEAGVKFWLLGAGTASAEGGISKSDSQVQRIRLRLGPPKSASTGQTIDLADMIED